MKITATVELRSDADDSADMYVIQHDSGEIEFSIEDEDGQAILLDATAAAVLRDALIAVLP